jgi:hypothetical protein
VAERMARALSQPIVIENVPGADGSIGVGRVARARPDGYTIEFGTLTANVLNGAFCPPGSGAGSGSWDLSLRPCYPASIASLSREGQMTFCV